METDDPWGRALALLTPDAIEAFRQYPNLRPAIGRLAVDAFRFVNSLDAFGFWITQHDRRYRLAFTMAVLDARDMGTTAGELLQACQHLHGLNRGVVADFLDRAAASGDLAIEPAGPAWGDRRLVVQAPFHQRLRDGINGMLGGLGGVIPEFADLAAALEPPEALRSFLLTFGMISTFRPDLVAAGDGPIDLFIRRDRGLGFLMYFLEHQAPDPDRAHLLERVALSHRRLAQDMAVSRMHVTRLLEEGEASGALSLPSPDEIVFSPELSDRFEARVAVALQVLRAVCVAARLGAPVDHGRLARLDRVLGPPVS